LKLNNPDKTFYSDNIFGGSVMKSHEAGEYQVQRVKSDTLEIIARFREKSEAEAFGREYGKNIPRAEGLIVLIKTTDVPNRKLFYNILN
jgi:hypothetical protein